MVAAAVNPTVEEKPYLSEVFRLSASSLNLLSFRLSSVTDRANGQRLSYRLSRVLPSMVVIWNGGQFFALAPQEVSLPTDAEWAEALAYIQREMGDSADDPAWRIQRSLSPQISPEIVAAWAEQILSVSQALKPKTIFSEQSIVVRRKGDVKAETIEIQHTLEPALMISLHSRITFQGTLQDFLANHPYRQNPEKLLLGLKVETLDDGKTATIEKIVGTIAENRDRLLAKASGSISRKALEEAPPDQPVVAVRFKNNNQRLYDYAMAALRPYITAETANQLGIDFSAPLAATKISYSERQTLLQGYRAAAAQALKPYGIQLLNAVNGLEHPSLFWLPDQPINQTPILFGQKIRGTYSSILNGLGRGGVYQRHQNYASPSAKPIRLTLLNLLKTEIAVSGFITQVEQKLKSYGFSSLQLNREEEAIPVENWNSPTGRAALDARLDDLMTIRPDLVFVFLPQSDRDCDDDESGSLYHRIYSRLLRRQVASQFIYEATLRDVGQRYILNQVMPGVLAKLGNVPFVLADPLRIADVFVGLDVSRTQKKRLSGSLNACAGVCLYGNRGEFIRSKSEDAVVEGEEIPPRFLEALLPAGDLRGKTVLIYRDGRFCGDEVYHLLNWANAIQAKFILVECRKSGVPRLYHLSQTRSQNQRRIEAPPRGLGLKLSSHEAILVSSEV